MLDAALQLALVCLLDSAPHSASLQPDSRTERSNAGQQTAEVSGCNTQSMCETCEIAVQCMPMSALSDALCVTTHRGCRTNQARNNSL